MRQLEFLLLLAATSAQVPFSSTPLWNHSLLIFVKPHFAHAWNYILLIFVKPQFAHICETIICSHFVKLNFAHVCETKFCSYLWNHICSYMWNKILLLYSGVAFWAVAPITGGQWGLQRCLCSGLFISEKNINGRTIQFSNFQLRTNLNLVKRFDFIWC